MHVTAQHKYAATPEEVYAMLTDPAFLDSLFAGVEAESHQVSVNGSRTTATATLVAPEQVRRFTGATITAAVTIDWGQARPDGSWHGLISVDLGKLPAKMSGTATLSPAADGITTVVYDANFTISVPFLGSTLEKTAAPYVMRVIDEQQPRGQAWLATQAK
ncbi:MAG: DUF2505 domain-containing protein [Propionibacteriaceae bacterium]|jgi:carbon monoxide dehydrogenase subunit G|nr:DUF2505 domain-containing protein [Propionibacteriaceae bacterium]